MTIISTRCLPFNGMQTTTNDHALPTPSRRGHRVPSFDLYGNVHRALRAMMTDVMIRMGRTVPADAREVGARLDELEGICEAMTSHIAHEANFLHVALERRLAGSALRLDIEHAEHVRAMEDLRALVVRVRRADAARRPAYYRALYLRYTAFVGEALVHMSDEEARTQAMFDELFSAAELELIHAELIASIPPPELMRSLQAMIPAVDLESRVTLLLGAKAQMPPEAFAAFFPIACAALDVEAVAELARRVSGITP